MHGSVHALHRTCIGVFSVSRSKGVTCVFKSAIDPRMHLAIGNGSLYGAVRASIITVRGSDSSCFQHCGVVCLLFSFSATTITHEPLHSAK